MILETPEIAPGAVVEFLSPYSPARIAVRIDLDPPSAAAFTIERADRLEPYEVRELAPAHPTARGLLLRVRNDSPRPVAFRAQVTLGPDTGPVQRSMDDVLERFQRARRALLAN